jgi:hypothetical protein
MDKENGMNHTHEIYQWMHELIENSRFQNVAYDANYLYASDGISLFQVARSCIIWKEWQKAHEECWHTSEWQWRKGDAQTGAIACGGFDVAHASHKAPRLPSIYAIIGSAVQNETIANGRVYKASHASKQWILEQDKFFGVPFNPARIADALNMPLFAQKCQFALLENGALRIANKKHQTAIAYVMGMNSGGA